MAIRIYNTLTRKKEVLVPLEDNHVRLYVCGITSYDYCHIGHARSAVAFVEMIGGQPNPQTGAKEGGITVNATAMENRICSSKALSSISGGTDGRPRRAYTASNSLFMLASSASTTARNLRSGCAAGTLSSRLM